jgi:redox-sensitive bicupin YhaK (pirin superfamily)
MPARTPEDPTSLPRLGARGAGQRARPVISRTTAPSALEGEGFPVRRAFAGVPLELLDPFVHMDQMGEVDYGPGEPKGTPWHPHRGFETVTYMIDGVFEHADSTGGGGRITNGDTQWMTAGAGILHIERPPEELVVSGGLFHGIQLWVNLPAKRKWVPPRYQDIGATSIGFAMSADGAGLFRVIAGELGGVRGPGITYTPINMVHVSLARGGATWIAWPRSYNALVYVLAGRGAVSDAKVPVEMGQLAVLGDGDGIWLEGPPASSAGPASLEALLLGGEPIREPIAAWGPFVMNSRAEIAQAFEDYRAGRMGQIPPSHLASAGQASS